MQIPRPSNNYQILSNIEINLNGMNPVCSSLGFSDLRSDRIPLRGGLLVLERVRQSFCESSQVLRD